jgi:diguanylate cyclase (GGDEF)-like protein
MWMRRYSLPMLLGMIVAIAAAVWFAGDAQRDAADQTELEDEANEKVLRAAFAQDRALTGLATTGEPRFGAAFGEAQRATERALAELSSAVDGESDEESGVGAQSAVIRRWTSLAEGELRDVAQGHEASPTSVSRRSALMDELVEENEALHHEISEEADAAKSRGSLISFISIGLLGLIITGLGLGSRGEDRRRDRTQSYGEALQAARDEGEAYELVRKHIEREIPSSEAAVFNRNNSADRLEPSTRVPDGSPLGEALRGARPEDCLAVRTARVKPGGSASDELLPSEICGKLPGASACVPSIVGGEVIGSVLVRAKRPLSNPRVRQVRAGVAEAAPVIAHLRNLAIAEQQAASDLLTGLPNKRAADETIKRMLAHASRTADPLSIVLFDLDHFKRINDTLGHPKGDEVLAAVGSVTTDALRDSDFAARFGGEEFILVLPGTESEGARAAAENLREAIARIRVPGLSGSVTASFGIASLPADAIGREELLRLSDRALYSAKRGGRNRVETASDAAAVEGNGFAPAVAE